MQSQERTRDEFLAERHRRESVLTERNRTDQTRQAISDEDQRKREREETMERQERQSRQERAEAMNTTLQTIQLAVMRDFISKPGGTNFLGRLLHDYYIFVSYKV